MEVGAHACWGGSSKRSPGWTRAGLQAGPGLHRGHRALVRDLEKLRVHRAGSLVLSEAAGLPACVPLSPTRKVRLSSCVIFPVDVAQHAARQTASGTPEGRGLRQAGEKPCVEPAGAPGRGGLLYQMKETEGRVFMSQSRDDLQRRVRT